MFLIQVLQQKAIYLYCSLNKLALNLQETYTQTYRVLFVKIHCNREAKKSTSPL